MVGHTNMIERAIRIVLIAGFLGVLTIEGWLLIQTLLIPR